MDGFQETREAMERAIRRLNVLEYLIMGGALLLAMGGGALVALLLEAALELPFRFTWLVASVLLFLVPALVVYKREARDAPRASSDSSTSNEESDDGPTEGGMKDDR